MVDEPQDTDATDTTADTDTDDSMAEIAEYLGEEIEEPLTRVIDARIAAAQEQVKPQTPEPAAEPAPAAALDRDALDDQLLDHLIDGNISEAQKLQQRPSAYSKPEGTIG